MRRAWLVFLLGSLLSPISVASEPLELANQAARDGNYAQAYCIWLKLAKDGNADAQHNIGWMYHNGYGMAINDNRAEHWWVQAAQQDHVEAQFDLGQLYYLGGVQLKRDHEKAIGYLFPAAVSDHEEARVLLTTLSVSNNSKVRKRLAELVAETPDLLLSRYEITKDNVNMRSGPGTTNRVVGKLKRGQLLAELGRKKDWIHVATAEGGKTGWVYEKLVKAVK